VWVSAISSFFGVYAGWMWVSSRNSRLAASTFPWLFFIKIQKTATEKQIKKQSYKYSLQSLCVFSVVVVVAVAANAFEFNIRQANLDIKLNVAVRIRMLAEQQEVRRRLSSQAGQPDGQSRKIIPGQAAGHTAYA